MTIEEMKKRKQELGYSNKTVAEKTGLPLSTVQKIFSGATSSPREQTIRPLEQLLSPRPSSPALSYPSPDSGTAFMLREAPSTYGALRLLLAEEKKKYTLEDYLALPDDVRVELIDGVFYDMAAPTTIHQGIAGYLYKKLLDHVLEHKGPCYPFISPVDVQLDQDDLTVVQPDVMVICNRDRYKNGRIFGAPDLVIEVLSPSTRKKDMFLKAMKYAYAGVREYWMVDPQNRIVIQYDLEHEAIPAIHPFDSTVPVLIWDGTCKIDFKEVTEAVSFLWETE